MSAIPPGHRESIARLDERDARALVECMTVLEDTPAVRDADGLYEVVSGSGRSYTVDVYERACSCPDACYNDHACKHVRRVQFACGMRPIPGWIDRDAPDGHLGEQVGATPAVERVEADGGPELVSPDEDGADPRPDECACTGPDDALVCWPCFRDGFDAPNPEADE